MTQRKLSGLVLGVTLSAATSAPAVATVTTGTLGAYGTNHLVCTATNVSKKDLVVTIEIVNQSGTTLVTLPFTIAPGKAIGAGTTPGPTQGFCRVNGASKRTARVALCVSDSNLNCMAAVSGE
jgi:hypothetical protein